MTPLKNQILDELYLNSNISNVDLSDKLQVPRQRISEIKSNLWEKGTIYAPTLQINPEAIDFRYYVLKISVKNPPNNYIIAHFKKYSEVKSIDFVYGEFSLIILLEIWNKMRLTYILDQLDQFIIDRYVLSFELSEIIKWWKKGGFLIPNVEKSINLDDKQGKLLNLLRSNNNPNKWPTNCMLNRPFSKKERDFLKNINLSREYTKLSNQNLIVASTISIATPPPEFSHKFFLGLRAEEKITYDQLARKLILNPYITDLCRINEKNQLLAIFRWKDPGGIQAIVIPLYSDSVLATFTTPVVQEIVPTIIPTSLKVANRISEKILRKK
jgi:DNA-binding Lrp family transcriptional regulator